MDTIQFYFVDTNEEITAAWEQVFVDVPEIVIHKGSIFDYPCSAIVSPANSFGFMNGGIDFAISKNLGWHIEKKLQKVIREQYFGELLIGQAVVIATENSLFPYLIAAPTMRTPMTIHRTPNVYLAMKAILLLLKYGKFDNGELIKHKISSIALSGLGTGIGQVPPLVCARQMRLAWEDVKHEHFATVEGWEKLRSNYGYFFTHDKNDITYPIN